MLLMYHFCYSKCAGGMLLVAMPNFALLCNELNHLLIYVLIMYCIIWGCSLHYDFMSLGLAVIVYELHYVMMYCYVAVLCIMPTFALLMNCTMLCGCLHEYGRNYIIQYHSSINLAEC